MIRKYGYEEEESIIMKKQILAAMTVLSMAALAGCSGNTTTATTAATTAAQTTVAETTAAETTTAETTAAQAEDTLDPDSRLAKVLNAGKFVVGTSPDFAPMEFKDVSSGEIEYVGSDIEFAKYIAEKLGVELEIKAMEFSAIQQAVQSGTVDAGISGFAYTEERAESFGLSDLYNVDRSEESGHTLLVKKGEGANYTGPESFSGKKVLAQNASLQQSLVTSQLPEDIEFQPVTAVTDGVLMIINDKADALAVSWENGEMLMASYPEIEMADWKFDHEDEGNVVLMKMGEDELIDAVNEIIAEVNESNIYAQWKEEAQALAESLGIE